jgi:ATPase subunit of ABC transporter with duplicated ATPase domains
MITAKDITLRFGSDELFKEVNITFLPGNCYGLIGANGSGKSTFLKILSSKLDPTKGEIVLEKGKRISVLSQDQFAYDEFTPIKTVVMGHKRLHDIMTKKEELYAKPDLTDDEAMLLADLEAEFSELDGWNSEAEAEKILSNMGIDEKYHSMPMKDLEASLKVRVLLAQALFGNPDVLLLDEPTNQLDIETSMWLEDFLAEFKNTAIVVSHDRHFLDNVCTHIADIDYGKIKLYTGNYSFWAEASQMTLKQRQETNRKIDDKRKEMLDFIARFSANASKARQATARKKMLDKLVVEDIPPSSRKYPYIAFKAERPLGNEILDIKSLSHSAGGQAMFKDLSVRLAKGDKVILFGNDLVNTMLLRILSGEEPPLSGKFKWGESTQRAYFPKDNASFFDKDLSLLDWLKQFSDDKTENFVRGFLGRMLFSGEECFKSVRVLSGGEKVRCMFARMMLMGGNVLLLDDPTNHLDLESITALNKGLEKFDGVVIFTSHDHQFIQTIANRVIEITPNGFIDRQNMTIDEYLFDENMKARRAALNGGRPSH